MHRFLASSATLLGPALALSAFAQPATAQTAPGDAAGASDRGKPDQSGAEASNATAGDDVVVTGARGLPRTVTDSPTPIDVVTGAELARTGKPGLISALNTLIPSFNSPARAGGSTATVISTGGLRGLNPDQTLILVNGKRRHKTSLINAVSSLYNGSVPADLDMIPVAAIDHIEVLRDGAAAQYGSDAVAGVINIILKKNSSGGFISGTAGQNFDRSDGETYRIDANLGLRLGAGGFLSLSASAKKSDASNRANPIDPSVRLYNTTGTPDPREATIDRLVTTNYGAMPQKQYILGYNAGYDLGSVQLYSFGTWSQRKSDLNATFRAANNTGNIQSIYPDGFRPREIINEIDFEYALGLRGDVDGWAWDLSTTYGTNRARLTADNTLNPSLGPTSPTTFYVGNLKSTEWVNSLDATKGYEVGGRLQVSAGLQHRRETYRIRAGDPASYAAGTYVFPAGTYNPGVRPAPGAQGAGGIQLADENKLARNNLAAYLELTYDPSAMFTIGAAGRYEHYDDASGDTVIGKINARFAPASWIALRGAANTGFRAPAPAQQIYASTTGQFRLVNGVTNLLSIKTLAVGSPAAVALGAEPLTPEKSTSYSAGLVLTPASSLNVTVDAYSIKLRNRIAITGTLTGAAVSTILVANGLSPDISAQYYTNAIDTRTRGVDVVASYKLDLDRLTSSGLGVIRLNAGYNYNQTDITRIAPNPPELAALGVNYVRFDRLAQGNLTVLVPRTKVFVGTIWTLSDVTLNTRAVRYGGYTIPQLAAANDRYFGPKWIVDAELALQATKNINLAIGANNLFNTYPDANGIYSLTLGSQQYGGSAPSPFGFTGGSYYGRATFSF